MTISTNSYNLNLGTFEAIPKTELFRRAVKIQLVAGLIWDYAETILDITSQMRLSHLKKLSRAVKELRRDYDYRMAQSLDREHIARSNELTELFETINQKHFSRLCQGLGVEMRSKDKLRPDFESLVMAVQMAMTVVDALQKFCADTDKFINRYFPKADDSILPPEIRRLAVLLPEFAGDSYDESSQSRTVTAGILLNEIINIDLYDENGII